MAIIICKSGKSVNEFKNLIELLLEKQQSHCKSHRGLPTPLVTASDKVGSVAGSGKIFMAFISDDSLIQTVERTISNGKQTTKNKMKI